MMKQSRTPAAPAPRDRYRGNPSRETIAIVIILLRSSIEVIVANPICCFIFMLARLYLDSLINYTFNRGAMIVETQAKHQFNHKLA
ncbi:hypothetical protein R70723_31620 [Paenibacillus sp. FSL R7-0273]|nr:hypothetical protein R70723_31620 [Paenibacillus sp. FSL R7-0273]